jgi:hypothetical protein
MPLKIQYPSYKNFAIVLVFLFFSNKLTIAQDIIKPSKSLKTNTEDKNITTDSTTKKVDTLIDLKVSTDGIKSPVKYKAKDSIVYDAVTKQFYLYNKSQVDFDDLQLKSDFINYNIDSNLLQANPLYVRTAADTNDLPNFKQGEQNFTFDSLKYNFKTQKAFVEDAKTQYGEGFIISEQVKRNKDKSIMGYKNVYTTCDADTPHFGIYCNKIKVIPDIVGISGPAHLVIEDIPTPLYLPFGIFPLRKDQHAGFILPQYGFRQNQGFALTGGGYYIPINEYVDLTLKGDIYTLGGWGIGANSNYNKRYSYNGGVTFSYNRVVSEAEQTLSGIRTNTFSLGWNHRVDPKKLRNATFSASVNVGSSNDNRFRVYQDVRNNLNNRLSSSITYGKSWNNGKYNLTATLGHEQNNNTKEFNLILPNITFSAPNITPFARKNVVGKPKWYEKIILGYRSVATNNLTFYDTAFNINNITGRNFRNGIQHDLTSNYNTTILKYFNFGVGGSYNEFWLPERSFKFYNFQEARLDTVLERSFFTTRGFGFNANLSTQIYGTLLFNKGKIKGLRHRITPNLSFSYTPAFGNSFYNNYYDTYADANYRKARYSYWDGNVYRGPSDLANGSVGFTLGNTLEAKVRNSKDTATGFKKVRFFDNFSFNTSYNIVADSFNLQPLNWTASTTIGDLSLNANAEWDFYGFDYTNGYRSKSYAINSEKKIAKFKRFGLRGGKNFGSRNNTSKDKKQDEKIYVFNLPFTLSLQGDFDITRNYDRATKRDTLQFNTSGTISSSLTISPNWTADLSTRINYARQKVSLETTTISVVRDLHCWVMTFAVTPYGYYRSYNFSLRPKAQILKDLNIPRNRQFTDNF